MRSVGINFEDIVFPFVKLLIFTVLGNRIFFGGDGNFTTFKE